ncbi:MAG: hypothetical protein P4L53_03565 [Candidatus Obscuribacterales bacterium]|nr:hypothetical protein [Candidatus Obscuribacterales bacterium]
MDFPVKRAFRGGLTSVVIFGTTMLPALSIDGDYVLTQRSKKMGDQYSYLTPAGIRLTNPRSGTSIVSKAPRWDIELFNDKTHLMGQITHEKYKHQIAATGTHEFISGQWERQRTPVTVCGLKCTEYRIKGAMQIVLANGARDTNTGVVGGVYIVYDGIKLDPGLTELMTVAYGLPNLSSLPLIMYWEMSDGSHSSRLETYRVDRTKIPLAFFDKPNGYKMASSSELVFLSPDQLEMMEMMAHQGEAPNTVVNAQKALNKNSVEGAAASPGQAGIMYNQKDIKAILEKVKQNGK